MSTMRIERVLALPDVAARTPSTMYIVKGSNGVLNGIYFTGNSAADINHVYGEGEVSALVSQQFASFNNILVFPTYTAMVASTQTRNCVALAIDATADTTVKSGAATYVYNKDVNTWTKVSEMESMDFTINWSSLQDKPTSAVADIDSAVAQRHSHSNKADLDLIGKDADGQLTFNGANVQAALAATEW